ncbi:MAG: hypothetical protein LQ337_002835 [Flavoplaca oasis]|nr:MAG: hypothetical protein LQ337_002835 [Flavoplaca oasis]
MPLQLHRVSSDGEFNEIVQCICESYATPVNRIWRLFRHDPSPAGFIELRDRLIREFRADPTACWLKVVDTEIGNKVVGAALWNTYTENPYPIYKDHPMEAYWWPEGEPRKFANHLLDQFIGDRYKKMARPHMCVEEANRLNLETFIEATDLGKLTYEACGLVYAGTNYLETAKRNASPAWKGLERDMQTPIHMYRMWRPAGGRWVEGKTQLPWEKDQEDGKKDQ